ncbi:MAG: phosphotyrosine protein phosphatase [Pseudomonadota bacterium]
MKAWINRRFGTVRGLLRLLLAYAELATGRLRPFRLRNPQQVKRVVYVCLGNICRSAYGHQIARDLGMNVASLGLSTTTGAASPVEAVDGARRQGIAMDAHRAVDWSDFQVRPGDLFLVMEVRQAHELRRRLGVRTDVQVCLLGMWCAPPMPHLHDPFSLSAGYFDTCFVRVREATLRLNQALAGAARAPRAVPASTVGSE